MLRKVNCIGPRKGDFFVQSNAAIFFGEKSFGRRNNSFAARRNTYTAETAREYPVINRMSPIQYRTHSYTIQLFIRSTFSVHSIVAVFLNGRKNHSAFFTFFMFMKLAAMPSNTHTRKIMLNARSVMGWLPILVNTTPFHTSESGGSV